MRVFLAWHNCVLDKRRIMAAAVGVAFSVLLMFMQFGFLDTVRRTSTLVYDAIEFDIILVSNHYEYLNSAGNFRAANLAQARVVPGVEAVSPFNFSLMDWVDPDTKQRSSVMVLGIEPDPRFVRDERIRRCLGEIRGSSTMLVDELASPRLGSLASSRSVKIQNRFMTIGSSFRIGMGFYGHGAVILSNESFSRLAGPLTPVSFGLVKTDGRTDVQQVKKSLTSMLPAEVAAFERTEFLERERDHYTREMPLGVYAMIGVLMALAVGAVVIFQVLSVDIANHMDEYATMKAAGFSDRYIRGVGFQQCLILGLLGYFPALGLSALVFAVAFVVTRLPVDLSLRLVVIILALTLVMSLGAGFLALRKLEHADPADLF